jgi:hypothetical protein
MSKSNSNKVKLINGGVYIDGKKEFVLIKFNKFWVCLHNINISPEFGDFIGIGDVKNVSKNWKLVKARLAIIHYDE